MPSLKELFQDQQAGLTVYSPDCSQSRIWGNLDHAIHAASGFQVVRRQWIRHDINSILRFYQKPNAPPPAEQDPIEAIQKYENIPADELQYGHLVVRLLMQGPSLLTIWQGENAIPELLRIKGETQPAEAATGSIRGSFWCDNGVCNLMHSSDDTAEAMDELTALRLEHWLDEAVDQIPLIDPIPAPAEYVAHSGISIVCDVVKRTLNTGSIMPTSFQLPASGDAKETNQRLTAHLRKTASERSNVAPFIDAFLTGNLLSMTEMLKSLPVTSWEQFVIQCGTINRDQWN